MNSSVTTGITAFLATTTANTATLPNVTCHDGANFPLQIAASLRGVLMIAPFGVPGFHHKFLMRPCRMAGVEH
jgi:hypothetical protein